MPSTITTPVVGRVTNLQASQLQELATERGVSVSRLVAAAVADKLAATERDNQPPAQTPIH